MVNISEFMVVTETVEKRSDLTQMFFELRNAKKNKTKEKPYICRDLVYFIKILLEKAQRRKGR